MARGSATKYPNATPDRNRTGTMIISGSATRRSAGLNAGRTNAYACQRMNGSESSSAA